MEAGIRPLEGIRVVDLADEKGELCGRLLSDLGAEVIRVEPPGGSASRRLPPFAPDGTTSLYFAVRNAGKRGATLDLDSDSGREALLALVDAADVLIESERPGGLAARGLGVDVLLARRPELVVVSITDFGQTGPYRDYAGTDMSGFAMGGMMHRAGIFEKPPLVAPGALAYDTVGVTAAYAALLALWKRLGTGCGQHVDVSVMESVANLSDWAFASYSASSATGVGARAGAGIYTLYRCSDGFVRMIVLVAHHWRALLEWMGDPEELRDPSYMEFIPRLVKMGEIVPVIERFFLDKKKIDVAREAQARGIPATPLLQPGEVLDNEHTRARETFRDLMLEDGSLARAPAGFLTIDGERAGPRASAPRLGTEAEIGFAAAPAARAALFAAAAPHHDSYPLRGLRVLDFGVGAVGVEVGRLLAEYGADVVKIETRAAPDFIRTVMGSFMNAPFASSSRSKRCFGVDLKSERGRELVRELAREADVLIENNGTGVMTRLGFGPDALREINPRIITFSSQMVGSSGPWKDWIGYGPNTHPVSGLQWLWNYPEDAERPAGSTNVYPDHFVGRVGAFAVLAGLFQRLRTGTGMHADAAQFESAIELLGDWIAKESLEAGSARPQGNSSSRGVPWGCYRCAGEDEWCVVNVRSDEEWMRLRAALGDPEWARANDFDTAEGRRRASETIDRKLSAWMADRAPHEAMEALQSQCVPAGVVAHARHHLEDPHLAARGYAQWIDQPGLGRLALEGPAFRGSDLPDPEIRPAPLLGEHTREIAAQRLHLSAEEIDRLIAEGVLEDPPTGSPADYR